MKKLRILSIAAMSLLLLTSCGESEITKASAAAHYADKASEASKYNATIVLEHTENVIKKKEQGDSSLQINAFVTSQFLSRLAHYPVTTSTNGALVFCTEDFIAQVEAVATDFNEELDYTFEDDELTIAFSGSKHSDNNTIGLAVAYTEVYNANGLLSSVTYTAAGTGDYNAEDEKSETEILYSGTATFTWTKVA